MRTFYQLISVFYIVVLLVASVNQVSRSQSYADITPDEKYPYFINTKVNVIYNDGFSLTSFYEKLYQLTLMGKEKVHIVHIGDSHIQADYFSGKIRQRFHKDFKNGGRGFVFPYRVAKTNEPVSYRTRSNVSWDAKRNVFMDNPLPVGVGGITIQTYNALAELSLSVWDQDQIDYSFTKFILFHEKGKNSFDFSVYTGQEKQKEFIDGELAPGNSFASIINFKEPIRELTLKCTQSGASSRKNCTQIYGMYLENDSAGVVYNTIGVNGAEYRHYLASEHFMEQLTYLNPDLIIISLGTNESISAGFNRHTFSQYVDEFVQLLKQQNPDADILLTIPPDSYRKRRYKNTRVKIVRDVLIDYCEKNHLAYWDLYHVMGGANSMMKWYASGLAAKDKLHFSKRGYEMQGNLFYQALMNGYTMYQHYR